jgi:hypothetical protein
MLTHFTARDGQWSREFGRGLRMFSLLQKAIGLCHMISLNDFNFLENEEGRFRVEDTALPSFSRAWYRPLFKKKI